MFPGPNFTGAFLTRFGDLESVTPFNYHSDISQLLDDSNEEAKKQLVRKIQGVSTQFQSGVFLGELRETLRQIRNPAKALRLGLPAYRQTLIERIRGVRNRRRRSIIASETWLEYVYGAAPLISDVRSGAEALARYDNQWYGHSKRVNAVGVAEKVVNWSSSYRNWGFGRYYYSTDLHLTAKTIYSGLVGCGAGNTSGAAFDLFGVRWEEILPTLWELTPWSFLIDYFTNVGDIITAWGYQFFDKRWLKRTQRYTVDTVVDSWLDEDLLKTRVSQGLLSDAQFLPYRVTYRYSNVTRDSYQGSIVPSFGFEVPGIGSLKWINIGALARLKAFDALSEFGRASR
jgi:hypothetical protein